MMHHGRDEADWDQLAEAGLEFLIEQAPEQIDLVYRTQCRS
jgi:hypothetical protein